MRQIRTTLIAVCILVGACTPVTKVSSGNLNIDGAYQVTLDRTWAGVAPSITGGLLGTVLTIDGPALNTVQLIGAITDGGTIVKEASAENPMPKFRVGMTNTEIIEFVVDSLTALGYARVQSRALSPAPFGSLEGVRFDIYATTQAGLNVSGLAQYAVEGKALHMIVYIAPSEHYFERHRGEVESLIATAELL